MTSSAAEAVLVRSAAMHEMESAREFNCSRKSRSRSQQYSAWTNVQKQGIVVFNTPGANANGVKELVIAGMLLAARDIWRTVSNWVQMRGRIMRILQSLLRNRKKNFAGTELAG